MKERLRALLATLSPTGSVLAQTVKGGAWMGAMNVISRGLQILMLIVVANLLDPADFGLMGIALLVVSGLRNFSTLGLDEAVIQRKEENVDRYLNTVWSMELVRGLVLAGVIVGLAPVVADVFNEPRAAPVLRVIALSPLLMAVRNPAAIYFQKNLNFHIEFAYRMSGSVVRFAVSVGWALVSPTVWALVAGLLAAEFAKSVFSFLGHEYRPRPSFHSERAKELVDYGKWITVNSVLYFLFSEGDDAVVGWLLSSAALGFYQTAYRLSNAPATEITQVVGKVMFPAFSAVQDDPDALREAYYRMLQVVAFITFPFAFGIVAVTDVFVPTFLGEKWLPMVTVMKLLTTYGLMRSISGTVSPLWRAVGRPDLTTKLSALRVGILAVLIVPVTGRFGIEGTAVLITAVYVFPMLPLDAYLIVRTIDGSYRRLARELAYPLVASVSMYAVTVAVDRQVAVASGVLEFVLLVVVGVVVYAALAGLFALQFNWGIKENVRSLLDAAA